MKLKINTPIAGHKKNEIVKIKVDKHGVPIEQYWRNRIRDAKIDKCVTII